MGVFPRGTGKLERETERGRESGRESAQTQRNQQEGQCRVGFLRTKGDSSAKGHRYQRRKKGDLGRLLIVSPTQPSITKERERERQTPQPEKDNISEDHKLGPPELLCKSWDACQARLGPDAQFGFTKQGPRSPSCKPHPTKDP